MRPFLSKIIIVGVGLIGGSIGAALKKKGLAEMVIGVDSRSESLNEALRLDLIDYAVDNLTAAFQAVPLLDFQTKEKSNRKSEKSDESSTDDFLVDESDRKRHSRSNRPQELLIVCTPVDTVTSIILQAAEFSGKRPLLITDAGSTKSKIESDLQGKLPSSIRYIGSHPIAGSEKSGPRSANPDLFSGRLTVLTPSDSSDLADIAFLEHFWNMLGSSVIQLPSDQHDSILARTSHLPHLLSVLLMQTLKTGDHIVLGPGFRSTTRLASGDPTLWTDVFLSNRDAVLEAIDLLENQIHHFRKLLESENRPEIQHLLTQTKKLRDAIKSDPIQ